MNTISNNKPVNQYRILVKLMPFLGIHIYTYIYHIINQNYTFRLCVSLYAFEKFISIEIPQFIKILFQTLWPFSFRSSCSKLFFYNYA